MFTLRTAVIVFVNVNVDVNINDLIPQHARHIGDVQPSVTALGNELGEADGTLALHLDDEVEEILSLVSTAPLTPPKGG